jgi:hypothetical protein
LLKIQWIKDYYPEYTKSSKIKHQKNNPVNKWVNELESSQEIQVANKQILSHRGNANPNHTGIPSLPVTMAITRKQTTNAG